MKICRVFLLLLVAIVTMMPIAAIASDVSSALWHGDIRISNSSNNTETGVIATANISSQSLIDDNFAADNLSDVAVQYNSADVAFMPGVGSNPWVFFVNSIGNGLSIVYDFFSSGATGGIIRYFPDDGGMTVPNNASLKSADNFTIEQSGYFNTDNGSGKNLFHKPGALKTYISATENITASILTTDWISPTSGSATWDNEAFAYDDNEATNAYYNCSAGGWSANITLAHAAIPNCNALRFYADYSAGAVNEIDLDAFYDSEWHDVFQGSFADETWVTKSLGGAYTVTQTRARFHNISGGSSFARIYEFDFGQEAEQSSVTATGISSGEHTVAISTDNTSLFFGIGVDVVNSDFPIADNLTLNLPFWHSDLGTSSFTSKDEGTYTCNATGAAWSSTGRYFDGTNDTVVLSKSADPVGAQSIVFWLKLPDADQNDKFIYGTSASLSEIGKYIRIMSNKVNITLNSTGSTRPFGDLATTTDLTDNTWHLIAFTWDGTTSANKAIVYCDTVSEATKTASCNQTGTPAWDITFGESHYGGNDFTGEIGEWLNYNRALTPAELEYIYNSTKWKYDGSDEYFHYRLLGTGVPDNDNDWAFCQNGSMPYMEYTEVTINGTQAGYWEWEYSETFSDQSANSNTATPTFRASSSDNINASLLSFEPVSESEVATFSIAEAYSILIADATPIDRMFDDGDYSNLPAEPINAVLDEADMPRAAWWLPFIFLGICIIGFIVYGATTMARGPTGKLHEGQFDGSLLVMFIVMEAFLTVLGKMGPIPLWPAYLFPIAGIAIILSRKHFAWG